MANSRIAPVVGGRGRIGKCDACRRDFPYCLLTPVGSGSLQACPRCVTEARTVVRTEARKLRLLKPA